MLTKLLDYYNKMNSELEYNLTFNLERKTCCNWTMKIEDSDDGLIFEGDNASINVLSAQAYVALYEWASLYIDTKDVESKVNLA